MRRKRIEGRKRGRKRERRREGGRHPPTIFALDHIRMKTWLSMKRGKDEIWVLNVSQRTEMRGELLLGSGDGWESYYRRWKTKKLDKGLIARGWGRFCGRLQWGQDYGQKLLTPEVPGK